MKAVCASILNVEKNQRLEYVKKLPTIGVRHLHIDVIDGKFAPTFGIDEEEIREIFLQNPEINIDLHLMVNTPFEYFERLKNFAHFITFHFESVDRNSLRDFLETHFRDFKIGLALKIATPLEEIFEFLPFVSLVVIMSVEPGWGGQEFCLDSLEKIQRLSTFREDQNLNFKIQVDGGINDQNASQVFEKGANWIVCGTFLLKNFSQEIVSKLLD